MLYRKPLSLHPPLFAPDGVRIRAEHYANCCREWMDNWQKRSFKKRRIKLVEYWIHAYEPIIYYGSHHSIWCSYVVTPVGEHLPVYFRQRWSIDVKKNPLA